MNGRFVSVYQTVRYLNAGLKTGLKKACLWSKMYGIQLTAKPHDFTIQIPDTHTVWYLDESVIKVFGTQMLTVFFFLLSFTCHFFVEPKALYESPVDGSLVSPTAIDDKPCPELVLIHVTSFSNISYCINCE